MTYKITSYLFVDYKGEWYAKLRSIQRSIAPRAKKKKKKEKKKRPCLGVVPPSKKKK